MRMQFILIWAFLSSAMLLCAEPTGYERLRDLSAPSEAKGGTLHEGIKIGLWTEKENYAGDEIRNVWMFARKKQPSSYTIGAGGNIYKDSFLYITDSTGKKITKLPIGGGIDGMTDPAGNFGGISNMLEKLPVGSYSLIWKTEKFESNRIEINIR